MAEEHVRRCDVEAYLLHISLDCFKSAIHRSQNVTLYVKLYVELNLFVFSVSPVRNTPRKTPIPHSCLVRFLSVSLHHRVPTARCRPPR